MIWNPDGSAAEFSGNGSRIAAAWLAARAGSRARDDRRRPAAATPRAIRDDGMVAMGVGAVEVGETETIELGGEQIELTPVSVGNPHAVVRLDAESRRAAPARPADRDATSASRSARTSSSSASTARTR